jgi:hypothetical protein
MACDWKAGHEGLGQKIRVFHLLSCLSCVIFVLALLVVLLVLLPGGLILRVVLLVVLLGFYLGASARCTYGLLYVAICSSSADQRISGGWRSHGGAEARREQSEETATRPGGQLVRPVLLPVVLEPPWLLAHRYFNTFPGHPSCAGA